MTQLNQDPVAPQTPDEIDHTAPHPAHSDRRFTPKTFILISVAVLAGTVGGTMAANAIGGSNNSGSMGPWMASYGSNVLNVSHDVSRVNVDAAAVTSGDFSAVRADCVRLAADVHLAQSNPQMPDATLESSWSIILVDLQSGARACTSGIDQNSKVLLTQAGTDFGKTATYYLRLLKDVNAAS
jgi:hypothetical protein